MLFGADAAQMPQIPPNFYLVETTQPLQKESPYRKAKHQEKNSFVETYKH